MCGIYELLCSGELFADRWRSARDSPRDPDLHKVLIRACSSGSLSRDCSATLAWQQRSPLIGRSELFCLASLSLSCLAPPSSGLFSQADLARIRPIERKNWSRLTSSWADSRERSHLSPAESRSRPLRFQRDSIRRSLFALL